jgi:hypothetical protein
VTGFEDLLKGMPQRFPSAVVLRTGCSWNLWTDLMVLGEGVVHVEVEGLLLSERGAGNVGLQYVGSSNQRGIQQSLAMSHVRCYGEPVIVKVDEGSSDVDIAPACERFRLITRGLAT